MKIDELGKKLRVKLKKEKNIDITLKKKKLMLNLYIFDT